MKTEAIYPTPNALSATETAVVQTKTKAATRITYIDSIRIFLTILVVLHHLSIIYTGSGSWTYTENREDVFTAALGNWFTAVNHSYFMGLFMLISAYFVPASYDRKGARNFVKDRLIRLGIPLVIYGLVIRPILFYVGYSKFGGLELSFWNWYTHQYFQAYGWTGQGPTWFLTALLIFSLLYVLWRLIISTRPQIASQESKPASESSFPRNLTIALFALGLAVMSFIVRLRFPSDTVFLPLNFQLADFSQYIALFIIGLVAYQHNWLERLPDKTGKFWLTIAVVMILAFPPIAILGGAMENDLPFKGGWHWQALLATTWQSFICVSMCISVIYIFRRYFNRQGKLAGFLSRNAYTVYLIHEPVITFTALALVGLTLYPLLKFGLVALITIPLCFGLSSLIRKLPYTQRVL
jgi:Acyltransferase family